MTVIFDLDDTLYPEMDYVRSAYREIAGRFGLGLLPAMLSAETPAAAFDSTGLDISEILELYRCHKPHLRLPVMTLYVLDSLCRKGCRIGLITDGRSLTQRNKIEALGLDRFVRPELVMISEEVGSDKLSGEAVRLIETVDSEETKYVYVGDNPKKDFYAPNQNGWLTVLLKGGGNGENIHENECAGISGEYMPEMIITNISEVLSVVDDYSRDVR